MSDVNCKNKNYITSQQDYFFNINIILISS